MGNICCADDIRKDAKGGKVGEIDGNTMRIKNFNATLGSPVAETVTESSADLSVFGTSRFKLDNDYFTLKPVVQSLIDRYGLYCWAGHEAESLEFRNNKLFRVAKADYVYEGQMSNNRRNGKGYMLKRNGDLWVCMFIDDQPCGSGAIYYESGDYFEGKVYKGNTIEGKMHYADGSRYEGQFMTDGYRDGRGTLFEPNGCRYEGSWKNNLKDGPGVFVQTEHWRNGVRMDRYSVMAQEQYNNHMAHSQANNATPGGTGA